MAAPDLGVADPHGAAVLFDLDGVIVDTAKLHYAAWKRLADSLALHFDEGLNQALKGVDRLRSLDLLLGAGLEAPACTLKTP